MAQNPDLLEEIKRLGFESAPTHECWWFKNRRAYITFNRFQQWRLVFINEGTQKVEGHTVQNQRDLLPILVALILAQEIKQQ